MALPATFQRLSGGSARRGVFPLTIVLRQNDGASLEEASVAQAGREAERVAVVIPTVVATAPIPETTSTEAASTTETASATVAASAAVTTAPSVEAATTAVPATVPTGAVATATVTTSSSARVGRGGHAQRHYRRRGERDDHFPGMNHDEDLLFVADNRGRRQTIPRSSAVAITEARRRRA